MNIQEIALSHNQKKKLLKLIDKESFAIKDDNGDIVVNVEAYLSYKQDNDSAPVDTLVGEDILDYEHQYFIFS